MKSLFSRALLVLALPLMLLTGCDIDVGADARPAYYHRGGYDGHYYSRGYDRPSYYVPARREARVIVEPRVRFYSNDRW